MSLFSVSRTSHDAHAKDDPLRPLRTMADRVGKEVQEFAERVDSWHNHGNESPQAKYRTTLQMVEKFKIYASSRVKELKEASGDQNKGDLDQSTRRRIQFMTKATSRPEDAEKDRLFESVVPSIESFTAH